MAEAFFVVVSGPPASDKPTVAPVLARELALPLVAKDTINDALMAVLPVADVEASRLIGRGAVESNAGCGGRVPDRSGDREQLRPIGGR